MRDIKAAASIFILGLLSTDASFANSFNWTRPTYSIEVGVEGGPSFVLGIGVDMRDPNERVYTAFTPYKGQDTLDKAEFKVFNSANTTQSERINFVYTETTEVEEEAKYLYAYFRASYGLANMSAAREKTKSDRSSSQSVYMFARKEGGTKILNTQPNWDQYEVASEKITGRDERAAQFVADFGSHYVSSITYGYTIVLRATVNSKDVDIKNKLTAKLKAGLGRLSAGGQLTQDEKEFFNHTSVNITATVLSGGIKPDNKEVILTNMEDVGAFISNLRTGALSIEDAPVKAVLTSWWARLTPFPNTREALSPADAKPLQSDFGVPRGTVIGWYPPDEVVDRTDPENLKVLEPEGWGFCNGSFGVPNIGDNFLRGAANLKMLGAIGGAETHSHVATVGISTEDHSRRLESDGRDTLPSVNHRHAVSISDSPSLPPYFRIMWLCKR